MKYVREHASGEYEEKKSRFIGEIFPVHSPEEAEEKIAAVRKRYYDARHHCYAYVLGDQYEVVKQSDDGEPSQTAGMPILNVLRGADIHDALCVVTRYFGGTLLGTGGLVRSYTNAARAAVAGAELMTLRTGFRISTRIPYTMLGKLRYLAESMSVREERIDYAEEVRISWLVPEEKRGACEAAVREAGSGSIELAITEARWYDNQVYSEEI